MADPIKNFYRYKLTVEYDGTSFCGWQWQPHAPSIQETLQKALFALTQEKTILFAAGRTDKGVHAQGQVVHVDLYKRLWDRAVLLRGLNHFLKNSGIVIVTIEAVLPTFHARFSAIQRQYTYKILHRSSPSALYDHMAWWVPYPLDKVMMQKAAECFVGTHDFSSFRHKDCQSKNPIKTIDTFSVRQNDAWIYLDVGARSFLHRQVRMMIGAIIYVASGKWTTWDIEQLLHAPKKMGGPFTAPAKGLHLVRVTYPD